MNTDDKTLAELAVCKVRAVQKNGLWVVDTWTDNGGWWQGIDASFSKAFDGSLRGHR